MLAHRATRVLPHIVDTLLLLSAISMLVLLRLSPLVAPWLMAKIVALPVYIGLGMLALRPGRSRWVRVTAWLLALLCAGYIVSVAYSKNPWGFLAALRPCCGA